MRITALLSLLFIWACGTPAEAGHSRGNGSCIEGKRGDAPLFDESQQWRAKAVEQNVQRNVEKCEEYLEEALRMIRKTNGEYPTE
jgi:hypothetical protein